MQDLPDFTLQDAPGHSSSSDEDLPVVSKTNGPGRFATQDVLHTLAIYHKCCNLTLTYTPIAPRHSRLEKAPSTSFPR
jgi:hypothetical protein